MFLFGHIGMTIGIVYLLVWMIHNKIGNDGANQISVSNIDFRMVAIAAMVPDIIDKVVGMIILKEEISNGRLFTHSSVIIGIISICLFVVARVKLSHRLKILYCVSPLWIHLLLDRMWEEPHTFFWPIFGTSFPRLDIEFSDYFSILLSNPYVFVGELLGILIIVTLFIRHRLFIGLRFYDFLKDGKLKVYSDS
ncbi:MAG: metal-dependent hydrolase [Thermoplasmata archaeon]